MARCPVCNTEGGHVRTKQDLYYIYAQCTNCGNFNIPKTRVMNTDTYILAGYLFEYNRKTKKTLELNDKRIEEIITSNKIPTTIVQKTQKLLTHLYDEYNKKEIPIVFMNTEGLFNIDTSSNIVVLPAMAYVKSYAQITNLKQMMVEQGWLIQIPDKIKTEYVLTLNGINYAEQLINTNIDSKKAFVAMAFRKDLLEACEKAIKPACSACGFEAFLTLDNEYNASITDEIVASIKRSIFVIADLTYDNNGAYYEAGFAKGLGREVMFCCKQDWFDQHQTHFDISTMNTITWKTHEELEKKLKSRIRATIPNAILDDEEERQKDIAEFKAFQADSKAKALAGIPPVPPARNVNI
jgi:nucleoside 2-deoxyribosyltransferase